MDVDTRVRRENEETLKKLSRYNFIDVIASTIRKFVKYLPIHRKLNRGA